MITLKFCRPSQNPTRKELQKKAVSFSHIPYEKNEPYLKNILNMGSLAAAAQSLAALEALDFLLTEECVLKRTADGRPYAANLPHVDFSLSHSGVLSVCALACGGEYAPRVGVDIEKEYEKNPDKLVFRFFSEGEKNYYSLSENKKKAFTLLWTRKEAYLKYTGEGLSAALSSFDVTLPLGVRFETLYTDGHTVTVCAEDIQFPIRIQK